MVDNVYKGFMFKQPMTKSQPKTVLPYFAFCAFCTFTLNLILTLTVTFTLTLTPTLTLNITLTLVRN